MVLVLFSFYMVSDAGGWFSLDEAFCFSIAFDI